ncbi:MerR family transcriptional regulator [Kribbella sp. DT2]|uniref:MerR family transcriptional regulator n=1 Tax=Kribbella sp. DT2 TaxID=3393427 RepID=UPI003CF7A380
MRIGEVSAKAGVSSRALRYYEEHGLLHPDRTGSGQRIYPASAVERILLIKQFYAAGLSSRLIEPLLKAIDDQHLEPALVQRLVHEQDRIAQQVAELLEAGRRLAVLIDIAHHPRATCSATELDPLT